MLLIQAKRADGRGWQQSMSAGSSLCVECHSISPEIPPASLQAERAEASSLLERRMAAMEAILIARRKLLEAPPPPAEAIPAIFQPPPVRPSNLRIHVFLSNSNLHID